jgi:hypothetical protein
MKGRGKSARLLISSPQEDCITHVGKARSSASLIMTEERKEGRAEKWRASKEEQRDGKASVAFLSCQVREGHHGWPSCLAHAERPLLIGSRNQEEQKQAERKKEKKKEREREREKEGERLMPSPPPRYFG